MRQRLQQAFEEATLVRIHRRFEEHGPRGYVVGMGPQLFLLLRISDEVWFDGFSVLRIRDVSGIDAPDPYAEFLEAALRARGECVERAPDVQLWNMATVLKSLPGAYPVIVLHQGDLDSSVCWIGAIVSVAGDSVELLGIDPAARWDESPTSYPIDSISRVDFGGDYEGALALVGGSPQVKP